MSYIIVKVKKENALDYIYTMLLGALPRRQSWSTETPEISLTQGTLIFEDCLS